MVVGETQQSGTEGAAGIERPLRIGLVTGEYPPMEGGVGAFTRELAQSLAARGHELFIFTDRAARPAAEDRRWQQLLEPIDLGYGQLYARGRRWRWREVSAIADFTLRFELDVVNIQYQAAAYNMRSPAINWLPWRLQGVARTVVTFHDLRVPYLFPKAGPLRQLAVKMMARQAHGVIATNAEDYHRLAKWGLDSARLRQIPIGSNIAARPVEPADVAAVRRALGLGDEDCLLGYFGFLNASKGADTLLHALAALEPHFHLVFIGGRTGASDPDNNRAFVNQLDSLIDTLGLSGRVHWTGFLDDAGVSAHLEAADLMVMPYRDGVSLRRGTLMAALAHGRPLISTTPAIPVPELNHGHNIWLVAPDDVAGLARTIRELVADPEQRAQLGRRAAETARLFSWDTIAARTAIFFQQLLD